MTHFQTEYVSDKSKQVHCVSLWRMSNDNEIIAYVNNIKRETLPEFIIEECFKRRRDYSAARFVAWYFGIITFEEV